MACDLQYCMPQLVYSLFMSWIFSPGPQHARPRYSFQSLSSLGRGGQALTLGSGSRGSDGLRLIAAFALFGRTSVVVAHHLLLNPRGLPSAAGGVFKRRAWLLFVWKGAVYRSLIGGDVWLLALLIEGVPDAFGGLVLSAVSSFLCCTCILHKSCRCGGRQRFDTVSVVLTGFGFQWSQWGRLEAEGASGFGGSGGPDGWSYSWRCDMTGPETWWYLRHFPVN